MGASGGGPIVYGDRDADVSEGIDEGIMNVVILLCMSSYVFALVTIGCYSGASRTLSAQPWAVEEGF